MRKTRSLVMRPVLLPIEMVRTMAERDSAMTGCGQIAREHDAAGIVVGDLRQKQDGDEGDQGEVPDRESRSDLPLGRKIVGELVAPLRRVDEDEDAGQHQGEFERRLVGAEIAIDGRW